jgi:hypothetical protein
MAEMETVAHGFIGSTIGIGRENLFDLQARKTAALSPGTMGKKYQNNIFSG